MRVLLITPLAKYSNMRWVPMGLGYISSNLKSRGHEVMLYDRFLRGNFLGKRESLNDGMKKEIEGFGPDIIGLSTISPLIHDTVECVEYIRRFYNGTIIAGGHHATAMPDQLLEKIPGLDHAAVGEAENIMLDLADRKDPSDILGLYSGKSKIHPRPQEYISDLDDLPLPDYSIFDMNYYTGTNHYTIKGFYLKTACVLSSRGCPNNCKFCSESLTFGRGVRFHSSEYVIENIERLAADHKVNGIYFHDNNFLASPPHAENICRGLIRSGLNRKIKWEIQTGTPTINDDILSLLSEAGCVKIELGIESIRDDDLRKMNKNADTDINRRAIELCRKHGLAVHTNFMTGFEGETISDLNNIIDWIKLYRPHTFSMHRIQVYPGTRLYETIGDRFFENNDWTEANVNRYFNDQKYDNIDIEDRKKWFFQVYKPFNTRYIRKSILKANPIKDIVRMVYKRLVGIK